MKDKPTSKFKVLRFWINLFLSSLVYMGNSEINYVGNYVGLEIVHLGMDNQSSYWTTNWTTKLSFFS